MSLIQRAKVAKQRLDVAVRGERPTPPIREVGVFRKAGGTTRAQTLSDSVPRLIDQRRFREARSTAEAACLFEPFNPIHTNRLGLAQKRCGDLHAAEQSWNDANAFQRERSGTNFAAAKYNLAALRALEGEAQEAVNLLKEAHAGASAEDPELFQRLAGEDRDFDKIRSRDSFKRFLSTPPAATGANSFESDG